MVLVMICAGFALYTFNKQNSNDAPQPILRGVKSDSLYNVVVERFESIKSLHCITTGQGYQCEELFDGRLHKIIESGDGQKNECYFTSSWILNCDEGQVWTIKRESNNPRAQVHFFELISGSDHVASRDWQGVWVVTDRPQKKIRQEGDSLIIIDEKLISVDKNGYPIRVTNLNGTHAYTYVYKKINEPIEINLPTVPAGTYLRINGLYVDQNFERPSSGSFDIEGNNDLDFSDQKYNPLSPMLLNFKGYLKDGTAISIYLKDGYANDKKNKKEIAILATVYIGSKSVSCQGIITNGYKIELIDSDTDKTVFEGTLTADALTGKLNDVKISLTKPLSAPILQQFRAPSKDKVLTVKCDDADITKTLNAIFIGYYRRLSAGITCNDRNSGAEIHVNENGILSVNIWCAEYCEGELRGNLNERFANFDVLTGEELVAEDFFCKEYKEYFTAKGVSDIDNLNVLIKPNGVLFDGPLTSMGESETYFFTFAEIKDIIKPYGLLYPFLIDSKAMSPIKQLPPDIKTDYAFLYTFADMTFIVDNAYFDVNGKSITEEYSQISPFFNNRAKVEKGGKVGFINKAGKEIISPKYDDCKPFYGPIAIFIQNKLLGVVDTLGKELVAARFSDIGEFKSGYARVQEGGRYGFIDSTGRVIEPIFSWVSGMENGTSIVSIDKKHGIIDNTGKVIVALKYQSASDFSGKLALMQRDGKYIFVDRGGVEQSREYTYAESLSEGLAVVKDGNLYGFINDTGKEIVEPKYNSCKDFRNGFAQVQQGVKWGFVNKSGEEIVVPRYTEVRDFSAGRASVKIDEKWGFIDTMGNEVIKPKYSNAYEFAEGVALVYIGGENAIYINEQGVEYKTRKEAKSK